VNTINNQDQDIEGKANCYCLT